MYDWNSLPLMLKVKDLQRVLGISRNHAYEMVNSYNFPLVRLGRSIRIPREELRIWIEKRAKN